MRIMSPTQSNPFGTGGVCTAAAFGMFDTILQKVTLAYDNDTMHHVKSKLSLMPLVMTYEEY
jgi:hypothetical protein